MRFPFAKFSNAEGARAILEEKSIFVTSPMDLNDPLEMRPKWTQENEDSRRAFRNSRNQLTERMPLLIATKEGLKPGGGMPPAQVEPEMKVEDMVGFGDINNQEVTKYLHRRFRVLSFVRRVLDTQVKQQKSLPGDLLLWAHYGDMFQGVVILFNPMVMQTGISPAKERPGWPIRYSWERVALPPWFYHRLNSWGGDLDDQRRTEIKDRVLALLTTKARCWRYERETRLLYNLADECLRRKDRTLQQCENRTAARKLSFPPEAVEGVIIGPECPIDLTKNVTELLKNPCYQNVKIYRSVVDDQDYRLQYLRSTVKNVETFQLAHSERVARSKRNLDRTDEEVEVPASATKKQTGPSRNT